MNNDEWRAIEKRLHDAVGQKLDLSRPDLHRSDHVQWWLDQEYDLDRDIIPAIKKVMVTFKDDWVYSWRLFDKQIKHHHRQRMFRKARTSSYADSRNFNTEDPPLDPKPVRKRAVAEWREKIRPKMEANNE